MGIRGPASIKLRSRSGKPVPLIVAQTEEVKTPVIQYFSEVEFLRRQKFIKHHANACWSLHDKDIVSIVPSGTLRELNRRFAEMMITRTPKEFLKKGIHVDERDYSYEGVIALPTRKKIYMRYYLKQPMKGKGDPNKWYFVLDMMGAKNNHLAHLTGYPTSSISDTLVLQETSHTNVAGAHIPSSSAVNENVFYNSLVTLEGFRLINQLLTEAMSDAELEEFRPVPESVSKHLF